MLQSGVRFRLCSESVIFREPLLQKNLSQKYFVAESRRAGASKCFANLDKAYSSRFQSGRCCHPVMVILKRRMARRTGDKMWSCRISRSFCLEISTLLLIMI